MTPRERKIAETFWLTGVAQARLDSIQSSYGPSDRSSLTYQKVGPWLEVWEGDVATELTIDIRDWTVTDHGRVVFRNPRSLDEAKRFVTDYLAIGERVAEYDQMLWQATEWAGRI